MLPSHLRTHLSPLRPKHHKQQLRGGRVGGVAGEPAGFWRWQWEPVVLLRNILEGQEGVCVNFWTQLTFSFLFCSVWSHASEHSSPGHLG